MGCFHKKKLRAITNDDKLKFRLQLVTRTYFILRNCTLNNAIPACELAKTDFFSVTEGLPHHLHAMKMVASSGIQKSFSDNVFVKNYLAILDSCHWVIYRQTLL